MSSQCKVSVSVAVEPSFAFELFTRDIDRWWRRGIRFRNAGQHRGFIALETGPQGRLFESFDSETGTHVVEVGRVRVWEPPSRLVFSWRNANFAPGESTEVEISFEPQEHGTLITVIHRGLTNLAADHPARHGLSDSPFVRMIGLWWGDQLTSLREWTAVSKREPDA